MRIKISNWVAIAMVVASFPFSVVRGSEPPNFLNGSTDVPILDDVSEIPDCDFWAGDKIRTIMPAGDHTCLKYKLYRDARISASYRSMLIGSGWRFQSGLGSVVFYWRDRTCLSFVGLPFKQENMDHLSQRDEIVQVASIRKEIPCDECKPGDPWPYRCSDVGITTTAEDTGEVQNLPRLTVD